MFIRPADPKMKIPYPEKGAGQHLDPAGEEVEMNPYWHRRLIENVITATSGTPDSQKQTNVKSTDDDEVALASKFQARDDVKGKK